MHKQLLVLLTGLLICSARSEAAEPAQGQWLLVTAPAFRASLAPLIEHRRAEGLKVIVIETTNVLTTEQVRLGQALPLQARVKELCQQTEGPTFVLLAGAIAAADPKTAELTVVPPLPGTVGRMKEQPGDYGYGFLGKDGMPAVAVGRFPARTAEEIQGMVEKTLKLERDRRPGEWRNKLALLAGNPGGGPLAEMMVEQASAPRLKRVHPAWSVRAIFNNSVSRFHLPSGRVRDAALESIQEGGLFWLFLGHSASSAMWLEGSNYVTRLDWSHVKTQGRSGVLFTCGCFGCQLRGFDGEGYGLAAIRNPDGPVAVIGATGESWSAPGQLALDGLLRCLTKEPFPTRLADYWLSVQAGLAKGEIDEVTFQLYDQFDGSKGKVPLAVQRLEHLEMWLLLGDPALRLPMVPLDVSLEVPGPLIPGKTIAVQGVVPDRLARAAVRVTLERLVSSAPADLEKMPVKSSENQPVRERVAIQNHERANNVVLATAVAELKGNRFACVLEVPAVVPWPSVVIRAQASSQNESGLGIVVVSVPGVDR